MGRWYGSLNNRLEEGMVGRPEPAVGLGMTEYGYSDRHAYRIVRILAYMADKKRPKEVLLEPCWVRSHGWPDGGFDVSMEAEKPQDEEGKAPWVKNGGSFSVYRTRKGNWTETGKEEGNKYCVTHNPSEYFDPSF